MRNSLCLSLLLFSVSGFDGHATIPIEGFEFQVKRENPPEVRICGPTKGTLFEGDLVIPDSVLRPADGRKYAVVEIGTYNGNIRDTTYCLASAFFDQPLITSVTLPKTVRNMYSDSFRGCTGIKEWKTDPDNPTYVAWDGALYTKSKDTGVPNELVRFPAASPLTEWAIPPVNDDMSLGSRFVKQGAFCDNSTLETLIIDPTVWLYDDSLLGNTGIKQFKGSGGRNSILSHGVILSADGRDLYHVPAGYTGVLDIPQSVERIFPYACAGTNCKSIKWNNVTVLGAHAFAGAAFKEFTLPASITDIGYALFENCRKLEKVNIEMKLTEIPVGMFRNCVSLSEVTLPNSCRGMLGEAFKGCKALRNFSLANYTHLSDENMVDWAHFQMSGITKMNWPTAVEEIPDYCFFGCRDFKSITLKPSTQIIGEFAFWSTPLETFNTMNLSWIKDYALQSCTDLKKIVIAETPHTLMIGPNCFQLNPGTEVYLDHKDLYYQGWNTLPAVKDEWPEGAFQGQMDEVTVYTSHVNPAIFLPRWRMLYCPALTESHYGEIYSRGNVSEMFTIIKNGDRFEAIPNYDWVTIADIEKTATGLDIRYTAKGENLHSFYPEEMLSDINSSSSVDVAGYYPTWHITEGRLFATEGKLEVLYLSTIEGRKIYCGTLSTGESIGLPGPGIYILGIRQNGKIRVLKINS